MADYNSAYTGAQIDAAIGKTQVAGFDLSAIAATKAVTAVDVFVYDTSKDSDGGAWRKRTQHTSWYNETLNTATRGSRREFPAVAVIVAEAAKVTIYDADDPSLPMWMVFNASTENNSFNTTAIFGHTGAPITSVSALNGEVVVGCSAVTSNLGVRAAHFVSDSAWYKRQTNDMAWLLTLADRNLNDSTVKWASVGSQYIVSHSVNDVAMTVLPDAPVDLATGLPVPTIAVATAGGVSVITDSGAVYDSSAAFEFKTVDINGDILFFTRTAAASAGVPFFAVMPITSDGFSSTAYRSNTTIDGIPTMKGFPDKVLIGADESHLYTASISGGSYTGGVTHLAHRPDDYLKSMVAYTTSTYNTGWMPGDIKGAFLSDTDDTDLVGGTDADRSVNNNPLTVNGTVTRTPVATGADLVAYSGFSASNYLEQPYNADIPDGVEDLFITAWVNRPAASGTVVVTDFGEPASQKRRLFYVVGATGALAVNNGTSQSGVAAAVPSDTWVQVSIVWQASGAYILYLNGEAYLSGTLTRVAQTQENPMFIGSSVALSSNAASEIALLRISATAPTADQIRKIYEDEKVLFQAGAQATLYGASDAVTALAHDPVTDLLHVGTSAGRSVFSGLRRVSNTTTAVGTVISASNGLVVQE